MPTIIELYIFAYFSLLLFIMLAVKIFLKTKANIFSMVIACLMFAIIKFLLDFYMLHLAWQVVIIGIYTILSFLVVHKLNHISKLIVSAFIFLIYYLCLAGINWFITVIVFKQQLNYISNYYLIFIIGLNLLIFATFLAVITYLKAENPLKLTQKCELIINNTKIPLIGFLDTGNALKDDKSGESVVVVSIDSLKAYLTDKMYADLIFSTNASGVFNKLHKLKYTTISGTNYITVFKPQSFTVNGNKINCFVGVTIQTMKYDALLSYACI